jgi:hypothetical protein
MKTTEIAKTSIEQHESSERSADKYLAELKEEFKSDINKELEYFGGKFDQWILVLKQSLLSEYQNTKLVFGEQQLNSMADQKFLYENQITELQRQLRETRDSEQKLTEQLHRRSRLVENMLLKDKQKSQHSDLYRAFLHWKATLYSKSNALISFKIARAWHERSVSYRILKGWSSLTKNRRRIAIEQKVRRETEYEFEELKKESAQKIRSVP